MSRISTLTFVLCALGVSGLANAEPIPVSRKSQCDVRPSIGRVDTPTAYQSPRFRWWLPGGWADADEAAAEIREIALAGFGGAEIGDVQDSISVPLDPQIYGWAQPRWNNATLAAYRMANELGVHLDYTLGPHWPTGVPGYTPDSPETSKELVHGQVLVSGSSTFTGQLPLPVIAPSGNETGNPNVVATPRLVAVLAAQTNVTSANITGVVGIDPNTLVDLTAKAQGNNGTFSWTAPSEGNYILVAVYGRGTGQIQNMYDGNPSAPKVTYPFPAYIVDHLSTAGVQASVDYWNAHILTEDMRKELAKSNGSLFEDSLELKLTQYWTTNFTAEFQARRGYDLVPYLLYVLKDTNTFSGNADVARRVQYDFYQTVSDLYIDYRLGGLKKFANEIGLKLRVQPYSGTIDNARAASVLDIPEGESLGFAEEPDGFRQLATGRDIGGKTSILSDELGAYFGKAYGVTWSFLLGTMNYDFALGVSQSIIHGFPYRDSPTSVWPGYAPFTPLFNTDNGFADAWGPRQPQWMFARNASSYMARAQMLMQSGSPSIDVAILNTEWGISQLWTDTALNDAGYTYQFPTPGLLQQYNATVANGRLVPDGPSYKALVVSNVTNLDLYTAQGIQSYAEANLPIVVVGSGPVAPLSYCPLCNNAQENANISAVFSSILSSNTTLQVSTQAELPAALASLGVNTEATSQSVALEGIGSPVQIDLWTGNVVPFAAFRQEDGYTAINITLGVNGAAVVYLGATNPYSAVTPTIHATSSDADVIFQGDQIYARATSNGTFETTLSNGQEKDFTARLPSPITPSAWTLTVQDWAPAYPDGTGLQSSQTTKTWLDAVSIEADGGVLPGWYNITQLQYASGVGVYETAVNLSPPADGGVYLSLGDVGGSWSVAINNQSIEGVDLFNSKPIDISEFAIEGSNVIVVTVATTLWNKLRFTWPDIYGASEPQNIGLLGPVKLIYFSQIAL